MRLANDNGHEAFVATLSVLLAVGDHRGQQPRRWRARAVDLRPSRATAPGRPTAAGLSRFATRRSIRSIAATSKQLKQAWIYDSGETGGLQTQPIVVDGVLYGVTPRHKTFALRAATGEHLWTFDSGIKAQGPNRGVMYWTDGAGDRRVYAAVTRYVYALDAAHRQADPDVRRRRAHRSPQGSRTRSRTPVRRAHITGRRAQGPADPRRARVGRTARLSGRYPRLQRAHRQAAVELSYDPSPGRSRVRDLVEGFVERERRREQLAGHGARRGARDCLRPRRARPRPISTAPIGSATTSTPTSLLALNADTGKLLWHFQFVRHDIWDRDAPAPPSLIRIRRDGKTIDAVAQATKHGYVFVFDRATGTPIYPIEYRKVPPSSVPGEVAADTQPFPTRPAPFARQDLTPETITSRTPEARAWALAELAKFHNDGLFVPLSVGRQTVIFPGFRRRRRMGRTGVRPRHRDLLCQRQRPRVDRRPGAGGRGEHGTRRLSAELRGVPSRRPAGRAAPDRVARRHRAAKDES